MLCILDSGGSLMICKRFWMKGFITITITVKEIGNKSLNQINCCCCSQRSSQLGIPNDPHLWTTAQVAFLFFLFSFLSLFFSAQAPFCKISPPLSSVARCPPGFSGQHRSFSCWVTQWAVSSRTLESLVRTFATIRGTTFCQGSASNHV